MKWNGNIIANPWIRIEERLPEKGATVLVFGGGRMLSAICDEKYYGKFIFPYCDFCGKWFEVTHWRPLPEGPEK